MFGALPIKYNYIDEFYNKYTSHQFHFAYLYYPLPCTQFP